MPPWRAIAIASWASVTVSIAALKIGIFRVMFLVSFVLTLTLEGKTFECCGTNKTSSNVKPSLITLLLI